MMYLALDNNSLKLLVFKKTILGQYEIGYFNKKHETTLLQKGQVTNVDLVASAIKEGVTQANISSIKEKDICLILPPETFQYLRITIPKDIANTAINSFVNDKVRATLPKSIENYNYSFVINENNSQREVLLYAIEKDILKRYQEILTLLDLKLNSVLPISLSYFKLFDKTLRLEKQEKILYIHENKEIKGYLYDSLGPLSYDVWYKESSGSEESEKILKSKVQELEKEGIRLNRLILSGKESDNIRQDTFTKNVGVWTNLLKRIIPNFYQEYLKLFIAAKNQPLPFLELDECFGAFIFFQENKNFSLLKENYLANKISMPKIKIKLPIKGIFLFMISFALSFAAFYFLSQEKPKFKFQIPSIKEKPTPTQIPPTPSPTPTPTIVKEKLKIKVLNGSGTPGKAASVVEILKNKNYLETISGGNADNFDYEVTEIQSKKGFSQQAKIIEKDLKDYITSVESTTLDEEENADVIIIIGTDFK